MIDSILTIKTFRKYDKHLLCSLIFTLIITIYHITLLILEYLVLYEYSKKIYTDCIYPKTYYIFYIFLLFQISYIWTDLNVF